MGRLTALKPRLQQQVISRLPVMQPGSWRADKTSSTARGYGYKWQQARAGYLRSHPLCVYCLRDPAYASIRGMAPSAAILRCAELRLAAPMASVVDHSVPHRGDMKVFWDSSLWQSLCVTHHNSDAQRRDRLI